MENLLLTIETRMPEHDAHEDDQTIERPELSLPNVKILIVCQAAGLEGMQVMLFVENVSDAVDVDEAVIEQRRECREVICAGGLDPTPFQRPHDFKSR
jgi:hypothetical protein